MFRQTTLIETKPILFFADAPIKTYPYQLATFKERAKLFKNKNVKLGIIDLGVYTYLVRDPTHTYPDELVQGLYDLAFKTDEKILIACPDYPPINFEHKLEIDYDNIAKTIENWNKFKCHPRSERFIYTVQFSKLLDFRQAKDDLALFPEPPSEFLGIGGLCRIRGSLKEKEYFRNVLRLVRREYPNHKIHVWGASLWHLNALRRYANSFDNSKWTRPVSVKKLKANWGCKNKREREILQGILEADLS